MELLTLWPLNGVRYTDTLMETFLNILAIVIVCIVGLALLVVLVCLAIAEPLAVVGFLCFCLFFWALGRVAEL